MERSDVLRRTWVDISLDAIEYNFRHIKKLAGDGCKVLAVVKADAYGHGDRMTAPLLEAAGADWFGVSNLGEAVGLRESGITKPILIFGNTPAECADTLAMHAVTQTVYSLQYARELSAAAERAGVTLSVHLKFDTGMGRIGFVMSDELFAESVDAAAEAAALPHLRMTGAFTHFASADEPTEDGAAYTEMQFMRFTRACEALKARGIDVGLRHCCNSAALLMYPHMHLDMVRPGIILYGLYPTANPKLTERIRLRPAMEMRTVVTMVKELPEGSPVSYNRRWSSCEPARIASTAIGYADGYHRVLTNRGRMMVRGQYARVVGSVCMDQTMLDVSGVPGVMEGDVVTVFGRDGASEISVDELAALAGTISYEIVCAVSRRVPRCYYYQGENVHNFDYARWKEK